MRRLGEIANRPIPPEQGLAVFAGVAVILLLAAAVLIAIPGRDPGEPALDPAAIQTPAPVEPDRSRRLENEIETAARRFMDGYLALLYGQDRLGEIEAASPELTEKLGHQVRVPPAARHRKARVSSLDAGPIRAGRVTVEATVTTEGITYPVILELRLALGRWLVERVGAE